MPLSRPGPLVAKARAEYPLQEIHAGDRGGRGSGQDGDAR